MNYRLLGKLLGQFTLALSLVMLPAAGWAIWFREWQALAGFLEALAGAAALGGVLVYLGRSAPAQFFQREALGMVGLGWLLAAAVAAVPYLTTRTLGPIDAYFEAMSGMTTTGATVIVDIEATPKSVLFWRSFTQWLGGMGIIVLFVAVLPFLGAGGKQLFRSEAPGPDPHGLVPRIRDTAQILWRLYLGFTVVQTGLLMAAGMSFYDALCHTFTTLSTGGFSTRQASIAAYDSLMVEVIIIVFMFLAGTNFNLYFSMSRATHYPRGREPKTRLARYFSLRHGQFTAPFRDAEWLLYIGLLVGATCIIAVNLMGVQPQAYSEVLTEAELHAPPDYGAPEAFRKAAFQSVSIMTTTGYATEDFNEWPHLSRMLLVWLMFVGGCAGSTGGGMKVIRILVLGRMAVRHVEHTFRPKQVRALRINDTVVTREMQTAIYAFFALYIIIFSLGCLFMAGLGLPFVTAVTSVIATLNNIGPGLELVGAVQDYSAIPGVGKLFLTLCMALGRLELFSICVLFIPTFWRVR